MNSPTQLVEMKSGSMAIGPDVKIDFFSKNGFELACRIAKALSTSNAVPEPFRQVVEKRVKKGDYYDTVLEDNPQALGNCLVALETATSIGMSVISVMMNADVIQGKLRWSSKFQIASINSSRRFSPLKFKMNNLGRIKAKYKEKSGYNKQLKRYDFIEHEVEIDNWECVAWAYELGPDRQPTKEICQSIPVSMKMAVEEGWYAKEGSKWQGEMRFQMLQYRAGTFFGSIYAPDVIMGMGKSAEEEHDIIDVTPQGDGSFSASPSTLQELRSAPDVGSIPTSSIDKSTGEISDADDEALKTVETSKPQTEAKPATGEWKPDPEEEAAIRAAEMAEAEKQTSRPRRERAGLNLE